MELIQLDWQMSNYTFTAVDSIKWPLMLSWSVQKVYKISKTLAVVASSSVATGGVLGPVRPVTCPLHSRVVGQSSQSFSSLSPGCKLSDSFDTNQFTRGWPWLKTGSCWSVNFTDIRVSATSQTSLSYQVIHHVVIQDYVCMYVVTLILLVSGTVKILWWQSSHFDWIFTRTSNRLPITSFCM